MRKKLAVLVLAVVIAVAIGLVLRGCTPVHVNPVHPHPVVNCAGDHDHDCPWGEPDNDGN